MPIDVEVNLRVPSLTVKAPGKADQRIDNGSVRFSKRIKVEAIPKVGEWLQLSHASGETFDSTVTRVEWDDDKNMFVVSCSYARRTITADEHAAFLTDSDWATKQLPS